MNDQQRNFSGRFHAVMLLSLLTAGLIAGGGHEISARPLKLEKGQSIPAVTVLGAEGQAVSLESLKGNVTLISVVPQLNTPVCDEQTHRFSERNGGLDQFMTFVTLSTNTYQDQETFAAKAGIRNMTFLSDAPAYEFGTRTGLLLEQFSVLHRAVLVLDTRGIIRYVETVPSGQLPDFDQALRVSRGLVAGSSQGGTP